MAAVKPRVTRRMRGMRRTGGAEVLGVERKGVVVWAVVLRVF
jgi:hypothetical protein